MTEQELIEAARPLLDNLSSTRTRIAALDDQERNALLFLKGETCRAVVLDLRLRRILLSDVKSDLEEKLRNLQKEFEKDQ